MHNTLIVEQDIEPGLLEQAFERFTEASKRLETRYEALLTETEQLRQQVREKDLAIKRAEKLSMLGETAAAIAHEVRNPLGAMKLFVSLLKRDMADRPESAKILSHVDQNISTLDHVVSNILQFAKKQNSAFSPVNVHSIIREQAEHFLLSPSSSKITLDLQGEAFIMGCEHALRQVFYNILLNAQQATRYSGEISVATANSGNWSLEVRIKDSGSGIDEAMVEKIFDPFVTTKNEGTGLGLAVVRQIIEEHGGTISARNVNGAEFTLTLPRAQAVKTDTKV
jgi:signal transduction histidine kinase